jgi:V/A-type H+-transporting ATPase subunit I
MKKVSLVVLNKNREASLRKLRELGVVHLEKKTVSSEALSKLFDRKTKIDNALGIIRSYEPEKKPKKAALPAPREEEKNTNHNRRATDYNLPYTAEAADKTDKVTLILEYAEGRKALQEKLNALGRERSRIEEWGNFDPKDISLLSDQWKLNLFLYKLPRAVFETLPKDTRFIKLGQDKNSVRLAVFDSEISGASAFTLPDTSLKEINFSISGINEQLANIEKQLASLAEAKPLYEREAKIILGRIEFEAARSGMGFLEGAPEETTVAWITGFVPKDDLGLLKRGAAENGWALVACDPGPDDVVPTKLKNNRFARLLNPLTDFLEVMPGYNEVDISFWFLLFFTIYFGMIFGDAAYGAVILIAAIIGIFKTVKKGVPPVLKLMLLLGFSNFVWGVLTCTWLGVDAAAVPEALQKISLPLISNVTAARSARDEGIVRQNLMILCFSLALLQLSIGHIIAITRRRTLKIFADLGSIAMLVGMYGIVLSLIASNEYRQIPLLPPCVYLLGGGFVFNFVFANYEGKIGKSILESLKNFISMVLGIANVFSDIMSYIRLWAVGLAGAAISSTVVAMAGPMLGHFVLFAFGVILLVFGHGLNLVLNALSVLVHAVRLNTLEFSGHVGLTWAGSAYKPFSETGIPVSREVSGKKTN